MEVQSRKKLRGKMWLLIAVVCLIGQSIAYPGEWQNVIVAFVCLINYQLSIINYFPSFQNAVVEDRPVVLSEDTRRGRENGLGKSSSRCRNRVNSQ